VLAVMVVLVVVDTRSGSVLAFFTDEYYQCVVYDPKGQN